MKWVGRKIAKREDAAGGTVVSGDQQRGGRDGEAEKGAGEGRGQGPDPHRFPGASTTFGRPEEALQAGLRPAKEKITITKEDL